MVLVSVFGRVVVAVPMVLATILTACALWYLGKGLGAGQYVLPAVGVVLGAGALEAVWGRAGVWPRRIFWGYLGFLVVFWLGWYFCQHPSNDRVWADDVTHIATGEIEGNWATIHNVRDFTWRSPTDYDVKWETRRYDLTQLDSVDLFISTWGGPAIGHALVSFGFKDGDYLAFSFEIRKEVGETFSPVAGVFRQYELALLAADERDIVYTRTNTRKEDVSRYRVNLPPKQREELFRAYVARGNRLAEAPEFYNTLFGNCITVVFSMMREIVPQLPMDYRLLLAGYLPGYIYELGGLEQDEPLSVLREQGRITQYVQGLTDTKDYSTIIRRYPIQQQGE